MIGQRLVISAGRVIDPANGIDGVQPVYIADGRIVAVGNRPADFHAEREIEVPGCIVCPGFIDLCARPREPGHEHKGTLASEGVAAAAAGVTTLFVPPDTWPVIDSPAVARLIRERGRTAAGINMVPVGALTQGLNGRDLSEMSALRDAGCRAVGNASRPLASPLVARRALEYAASHGLLVMLRPQDPSLRDGGCMHEGPVATRLGLPGIPEAAETLAVAQLLVLIEQTGVRAHFGQLSSARAASMLLEAQARGLAVSADVAVHQLFLTEDAVADFDAMCHVDPPFRSAEDRAGLRSALANGAIGAICSDHQPHDPDAKLDVFSATEAGVSSIETLLPLMLRLVAEGVLSLPDALARLTSGPAAILGLPGGRFDVGAPADLCVFDPEATWIVDDTNWRSQGRNTPFWGQPMYGRVRYTVVAGRPVFGA
ncbi:MAG: dihydroorotase [Methylotetracoccus sp.]